MPILEFLLFIIIVIIFSAAILILKKLVVGPVLTLISSIKKVRSGKHDEELETLKKNSFFGSFAKEISKISSSLMQARNAASREARMRLEKLDTPWTAERLKEFVKVNLKGQKIFAVSNREPYMHFSSNEYSMPASGMVTAIDPIMQSCEGVWLAAASGIADRETADKDGKIMVPPDDPKYTLKRLWLDKKIQNGFYSGFCNSAIWPLCHNAHVRPIFNKKDWQDYKAANGKFTEALLSEIKGIEKPLILVQDFHLALLPEMVKKSRPDARVGLFWHIPWPSAENFVICPWYQEILEGMMGADIIGFHTQLYCNNFMETVGKSIESIINPEQFSITYGGHLSHIKPFPISISFGDELSDNKLEKGKKIIESLGIKTKFWGLGVDRLDYTKGILERFKAIEFFLSLNENYKNNFTFLQIAEPSRESVERYREFNEEVTAEAIRINKKFGEGAWNPIILVKKHLSHQELYPLYRKANFCLVSSLHDGMNLVSKEFVAAREDEQGVLILSQFTGASKELKGAIIINPYSIEDTALAIKQSLVMKALEQKRRMKKMRESIKNYNIYRWSAEFIKAILNID